MIHTHYLSILYKYVFLLEHIDGYKWCEYSTVVKNMIDNIPGILNEYYIPGTHNLIKFDKSVKECMLMGSTRHPNGEYRSDLVLLTFSDMF